MAVGSDTNHPVVCGDCGAPMVLRKSRYGPFYGCSRWPVCKGKHGAHRHTGEPLGIPADQATRSYRISAHDAFDTLWKGSGRVMSRPAAYQWLMVKMNLPVEEAHIGQFTREQCEELIRLVETEKPENRGVGAGGDLLRQIKERHAQK